MPSAKTRHSVAFGAFMLCALAVLLVLAPVRALAQDYTVGPVSLDVTVGADGSLAVVEQRTYVFAGSFNGIYWDVPRGSYKGRTVEGEVQSVGILEDGALRAFAAADDGSAGSYELSAQDDCWRLTLFWPTEDQAVTFQVSYQITNVSSRWADTAELYWQYVPADTNAEVEWTDVTATMHLPVPAGEAVEAGENVRAWAHGPLDGEVSFEGNDVVFFSPGVGTAEFLEARIAFPPAWLSEVTPSVEARLETIMAEEDQWAKEANAKRRNARLVAYGIPGFLGLFGIGSVVAAIVGKKRQRSRSPKPQFREKYLRDVPTNDHPAVLGMLYRSGQIGDEDFLATLMRLVDRGWIRLDAVWHEVANKRGKTSRVREWRLLKRGRSGTGTRWKTRAGGNRIDETADDFLFKVVSKKNAAALEKELCGPAGEPYVLESFFEKAAKQWPYAYEEGYKAWSKAVQDAYDQRAFVTETNESLFPGALGLADFAIAVVVTIAGVFLQAPGIPLTIGFLVCFGGGLYCVMTDDSEPIPTFSQEAVDLRAQLGALRRWLCDFTRLEEAIPDDIVLWNRLLVMATELGVADRVVDQLREFAPEILANPDALASSWYARDDEIDLPMACITRAVDDGLAATASALHHNVSTSSLASSRDSSSGGSGGGFSSGGGGGFSGGGRGGAF